MHLHLPHNCLSLLKSTVIGPRNLKVSTYRLLFLFSSGFLLVSFELGLVATQLRDELMTPTRHPFGPSRYKCISGYRTTLSRSDFAEGRVQVHQKCSPSFFT